MKKVVRSITNNPFRIINAGVYIGTKISDGVQGLVQNYNNFYENNNLQEFREILNYKLDEVFIGWKHISEKGSDIKSAFAFVLPEAIVEKNLNQASIYVSGEYKGQEIFIEFGPYTSYGKGPTYCHYYYKNAGGLRFSKTTFDYWSYNIVDDYIKVSNNRNMTVGGLLSQVTRKYFFSANNFRVYGENGNYFVGECVKVMNAKRFKGRNFRGNHTLSISKIPAQILDALEDNENDTLPNVSKIPIIGGIADFFDALIN